MTQQQIKRFYKEVDIERTAEGIEVRLDGRSVRTPMRANLRLPTVRLARAVAAEWADQMETVDLSSMPMTGFANTALDRVAPRRDEVIDELTGYAETDLLCYRADEPAELVERQESTWQPQLDWLEDTHGARLVATSGIVHVAQNEAALAIIRGVVSARDEFSLTGVHVLTTGTGSVVLGLAVADGALDAAGAAAAGHLDELFQSELWGEDAEATARRERIEKELASAETFLGLLLAES